MFNATNQLTNITNNNIVSSSKQQWRKPDNQHARTAARELELQQKLKHSSATSSQPGLKDKENGGTRKPSATIHFTDAELTAKRKEFAKCRFYLDNLESSVQGSIERGIKLLGASQERFFSNKCTHLITTKHIPIQDNLLQSSCDTNATKQTNIARKNDFVPKDTIVENALSWGIVLWSSDVMVKTVDNLMNKSRFPNKNSKRPQEKRPLNKVLQDEKLYGLSTGVNSDAQSKRPHFVPFTGHYLVIEDATHVHRPVILRQYTHKCFTKKPTEYPWPYLKMTEGCKSPFGKAAPPPKKEKQPDTTAPTTPTAEAKENNETMTPPQTPNTSTAAAHINPCTPNTTTIAHDITTPPATPPVAIGNHPDSQHSLRASGFQPSLTNNTQSVSTRSVPTSVSAMQSNAHRRLPTGEINRLDKRMVENVTQNEHQKLHKQVVKSQREKELARKEKGKKKDLRYCENCNCQFEKMEDHINDPTHQTFIRDQNNFSQLDKVLEKTRRVYKQPLPDRWKSLVDVNIDGKNVQFAPSDSNGKRSRTCSSSSSGSSTTTSPASNKLTTALMMNKQAEQPPRIVDPVVTAQDKNQGWGKYHDVFL